MRVGAALKRRRNELGLTQQDVATRAGLSVRTVGKIEQGQAGRHWKSVEQLARMLRLDLPADAACPRIQVCLLGPLVVRLGGQAQELGAQKQRSLLGLLALHNGSTVGQDEIVETLWGHRPPATWHNLIHTYVTRLRKALGADAIVTGPRGYRLSLEQEELDLAQFDALIKAVNGIPPAVDSLATALDCWRGPLLAGLPGELRQHPVAVAVQERRVSTALTYSDMIIDVESGRQDEAVRRLQLVIVEEPLHEGLIARLILLLAASGRQTEAINRFIDIRDRLHAELGVDPSRELQQAHQRVLGQRGTWAEPQPIPRVSPAQLPAEVTGFTGRSRYLDELDELDELHVTTRSTPVVISAIAGQGGVGKTALAVHWAHRAKEHFPDGQLYVNLRGYDLDEPLHPTDALAGFLRALGVDGRAIPREMAERAALYRTMLAGQRILVILDNARTVETVRPLLPGTPEAFVVITSRDSLRGLAVRDGAHHIKLGVLGSGESRALLENLIGDRVRSAPEAADTLAAQCARLPLALRLAADLAATRPDVELSQLTEELADEQHRLTLLATDDDPYSAIGPVFSWSYNTLSEAAARLFRLLGLLPNEDVDRYVGAAVLRSSLETAADLLEELTTAHLLEEHVRGRYHFHDLLRAYARHQAEQQEHDDVRQDTLEHLVDFYLDIAPKAIGVMASHGLAMPLAEPLRPKPALETMDQAVAWLETERPNLMAVTRYTAGQGWLRQTSQLSNTLQHFLDTRCYYDDSRDMYNLVLVTARTAGDFVAESRAQFGLGLLHWRQGTYTESLAFFKQAQKTAHIAGASHDEGGALNGLGITYGRLGDYAQALTHHQRALTIGTSTNDARVTAHALRGAALSYFRFGRIEEALAHFHQAFDALDGADYRDVEGYILHGLGQVHWRTGRYADALTYYHNALALARNTGYTNLEADSLNGLGHTYWRMGDNDEAINHHRRALTLAADTGSRDIEGYALNGLGRTCWRTGTYEQAMTYHRQAIVVALESGNLETESRALTGLGYSYQALGDHYEALSCQRRALTLARDTGERSFEAEALNSVAEALHVSAEPTQALEHLRQAVKIAEQTGDAFELAHAHAAIAAIYLDTDHLEKAERHRLQAVTGYSRLGVPESEAIRRLAKTRQ